MSQRGLTAGSEGRANAIGCGRFTAGDSRRAIEIAPTQTLTHSKRVEEIQKRLEAGD